MNYDLFGILQTIRLSFKNFMFNIMKKFRKQLYPIYLLNKIKNKIKNRK